MYEDGFDRLDRWNRCDGSVGRVPLDSCEAGVGMVMIPGIALTLKTKGGLKWLLKKF
jgi:hypothetical protein